MKSAVPVEVFATDVLVIGAGGAGLRAALEASWSGADVVLVIKGKLGASGTTAYHIAETAGFAAADGYFDSGDNPDVHLQDIIEAGCGMCDPILARILAYESPAEICFLKKHGVSFVQDSSSRDVVVKGCFASRCRNRKILGHGVPIVRALEGEVRRLSIPVIEDAAVVELLTDGSRCTGAVCADPQGRVFVVKAGATVLATGGGGQLYAHSLNPSDITGDGYALGLRAGASLINMEFMQAGLATTFPIQNMIMTWLWLLRPSIMTAENGNLLNRYLPDGVTTKSCMAAKSNHYPFSSRDDSKYLEIAVQDHYRKINGDLQLGCYLSFSHIESVDSLAETDGLKAMLKITYDWMRERGLDILRQPVPIACFAHAINGGLRISENAETTLPGLFAAGEVAGGPHGADRLGGTMLAGSQVFSRRAGKASAAVISHKSSVSATLLRRERAKVDEIAGIISDLRGRTQGVDADRLMSELQKTMSLNTLVCRSEESLAKAAEDVAYLRGVFAEDVCVGPGDSVVDAMNVRNLLDVAEIVIGASLRRRESRGSHYRTDFPTPDSAFDKVINVTRINDRVEYNAIKL